MTPTNPTNTPTETSQNPPAPARRPSGRFRKGASGNPKGRPRGSRNKATLLIESLLQGEAEQLTRKLIEMASSGDSLAMKLCMDRLLPAQKDRPIDLPLGPVETVADVRSGISTVLQAIGDGRITPTEGETFAQVLNLQGNVVVHADLAPRLAQFEETISSLQDATPLPKVVEITTELQDNRTLPEVLRDAA